MHVPVNRQQTAGPDGARPSADPPLLLMDDNWPRCLVLHARNSRAAQACSGRLRPAPRHPTRSSGRPAQPLNIVGGGHRGAAAAAEGRRVHRAPFNCPLDLSYRIRRSSTRRTAYIRPYISRDANFKNFHLFFFLSAIHNTHLITLKLAVLEIQNFIPAVRDSFLFSAAAAHGLPLNFGFGDPSLHLLVCWLVCF